MQKRVIRELSLKEKGLVDIHSLLRQLRQLIEAAEWDGTPCENLKLEYKDVLEHHMKTGSHFYPLF